MTTIRMEEVKTRRIARSFHGDLSIEAGSDKRGQRLYVPLFLLPPFDIPSNIESHSTARKGGDPLELECG
jgi:hypothetical protein